MRLRDVWRIFLDFLFGLDGAVVVHANSYVAQSKTLANFYAISGVLSALHCILLAYVFHVPLRISFNLNFAVFVAGHLHKVLPFRGLTL